MDARSYIEAIAAELSRVRGAGLLLSPADAPLALGWHAAGIPLDEVVDAVRRGTRLRSRRTARGAGETSISLTALAADVEGKASLRKGNTARVASGRDTLAAELRAAAAAPGLRGRAHWQELAGDAEQLLRESSDAYWTRAIAALRASLRELKRDERSALGRGLRERFSGGGRPA